MSYASASANKIAQPHSDASIIHRIDQLKEAMAQLRDEAGRAEYITSALCGSQPPPSQTVTDKPSPVPNGLLEELDTLLGNMRAHLGRIETAHGRASTVLT